MPNYGDYGKPVLLFEAYKDWRDERLALDEAATKTDFPSFLYGPVKQSLWHGYSRPAAQYRRYARVENASDFRERRLRGLNGLNGIAYVGERGNYQEMNRSERPPATLVVDTYGSVYGISRQAIRNDDTGDLLNRNPADMGYAAGVFIIRTIIAMIESNPTAPDAAAFFSGGRGNQTTTALSENSLVDAISYGEDQLDDDGRQIVVTYKNLVIKNAKMELIARRILRSSQTGTTINDSASNVFDKGNDNVVAGILPDNGIVRDPWWSDANDWYLFADPSDVPAFAVGFLDGKEEPFVGLKDPGVKNAMGAGEDPYSWEFDSVDFKVRFDFGVAPVDPRGAYRGVVA